MYAAYRAAVLIHPEHKLKWFHNPRAIVRSPRKDGLVIRIFDDLLLKAHESLVPFSL